jgi:citrate lyase alpha subunit
MGFKDLTLASSSLMTCNESLIEHIKRRYHPDLHLRHARQAGGFPTA